MEIIELELSAYILIQEDEKLSGLERNGSLPSADSTKKVKELFFM